MQPSFAQISHHKLSEGFDSGLPPVNWFISNRIASNYTVFGTAAPSVQFNASNAQLITKHLDGVATQLKFWIKGAGTDSSSAILVEGFNGSKWVLIQKIKSITHRGHIENFNDSSQYPLPQNINRFRFTYIKSKGSVVLDDISINYDVSTPSFIKGFDSKTVKGNSKIVTGLKPGVTYYYRLRVKANDSLSENSNIINVTTCNAAVINRIDITDATCSGSNTGAVYINTGGALLGYRWIGSNGLTSTDSSLENIKAGNYHLTITSNGGCAVDTNIVVAEPPALMANVSVDAISCNDNTTTLTVGTSGGVGNYHYTLSDGASTTGPQDDNHFTVSAGNYTVVVEDDNHCSFITTPVEVYTLAAINAVVTSNPITCTGGTTTLIVSANGGTGNYHYTLSDGINTTAPQDDNHFTVSAGNYTIIVEDDNHCSFTTEDIFIEDGLDSMIASVLFKVINKGKIKFKNKLPRTISSK